MRLEVRQEVVSGEERRARVLERGRTRAPWTPIEERELAEELPWSHDRDERLLPELTGQGDLHRAVEDHVQVGSGVILAEDGLSATEALRAHTLSELRQLRFGEA